ncbi:MAG: FAD-dependent oxidoreductase [Rickettsiaceae bacterium]|jgi:renalase|nr:FAD-dependent oxidoreductase [Rickettsiaceae bacterium]
MKKIAIIGAGLSGITLAKKLKDISDVTIFEKARGLGGRMSTHYAGPYEFDHGAQFFTARSLEFKKFLIELNNAEVIQPWEANFVEINDKLISHSRTWGKSLPHYVGVPRMNSIVKYMSQDINIKLNTHITFLRKYKNTWLLRTDKGETFDNFDWIISTAPAQQSAEILSDNFSKIESLRNISMTGCYALMLGFTYPLEIAWDAALVKKSIISWISVNSSKPGRGNNFAMVILTNNKWADENINTSDQLVIDRIIEEVSKTIGQSLKHPIYRKLQKWRYANAEKNNFIEPFIDFNNKISCCGDWLISGRVESAFLSASNLAQELKKRLLL